MICQTLSMQDSFLCKPQDNYDSNIYSVSRTFDYDDHNLADA